MHLNRLDLNLLVSLDALLTEQSVTRAANKLCISQPAMSGALTRLREHFEDELIVRVGRNMVLTPFGVDLAPRLESLLSGMSKLASLRPRFNPETSDRSFTLVASDYALAVMLPNIIPKVIAEAPNVSLNVEMHLYDYEQRLAHGMIDLVIVPHYRGLPAYPTKHLYEDEYVCVAWIGNTEIGDQLTLEDYLRLGHVVRFNRGSGTVTLDELRLQEMGYQRRAVVNVPNFETLPRMVVGTPLIATVQRRLAEQFVERYPIRILKHPIELSTLSMCLQWPPFREEDPGSIWLRETIARLTQENFS